jgi:hypothetical protein
MSRLPAWCFTFLSALFSFNDLPGFLALGFWGDLSGITNSFAG